jgi:hypothetical protein
MKISYIFKTLRSADVIRFLQFWIEISFVICACALSVLWSSACVFATQQWPLADFKIRRSLYFGEFVLQFVQLFRLGGSGF